MAEPVPLIGLTGGIATGKTTVSNHLASRYGLTVLDADLYARAAVQPDSPILHRIVQRYGAEMLRSDGTLDRARLGNLVFANQAERVWLEQQIHPYVRQGFATDTHAYLSQGKTLPLILSIPLLFEVNLTELVTEIWVVNCPQDLQIQRLMQRNGLSQAEAIARINSQMPLAEKVARATVVLDNSTTQAVLLQQVDTLVHAAGWFQEPGSFK